MALKELKVVIACGSVWAGTLPWAFVSWIESLCCSSQCSLCTFLGYVSSNGKLSRVLFLCQITCYIYIIGITCIKLYLTIYIYTYIWHHIWHVLCCVHETWQDCLAKSAKWLSVHSCCQDVGGNPEVKSFGPHLRCCWDLERKKQLATSAGLWRRWASQNDAVMQCFASNCKASCSKLQRSMVISRLNTN
jgi:hypothetical protein